MKVKSYTLNELKTIPVGEACLIVLGKGPVPFKRAQKALERRREELKKGEVVAIPGIEKDEVDLWVCRPPEETTTFALLGFAAKVLKAALQAPVKTFSLVILDVEKSEQLVDCLGAALAVRIFPMPVYGKRVEKVKSFDLMEVQIFASTLLAQPFRYGYATGEGTNLVRYLATLPPNQLDTKAYGAEIRKLAKRNHFKLKFYSNTQLKKIGAGAFTAVDRGNPHSNGGIYELSYTPKNSFNKKPLTLVGKGICFDTGGYDVKTAKNMVNQKGDMSGSAIALSALIAVSRLGWPIKMKAYLVLSENLISPTAYKADEVIQALNGMAIEVNNSDAEGRMVLADTLTLASRDKPEMIIDFATLTGAAIQAIGNSFSAGFSNREILHPTIIAAGKTSGERVWPFPLEPDVAKGMESSIADIVQSAGPPMGHIYAAHFLSQFVDKDIPWVHIDLAAASRSGGLAHVDSLFTGFGVRWTLEFIKLYFNKPVLDGQSPL